PHLVSWSPPSPFSLNRLTPSYTPPLSLHDALPILDPHYDENEDVFCAHAVGVSISTGDPVRMERSMASSVRVTRRPASIPGDTWVPAWMSRMNRCAIQAAIPTGSPFISRSSGQPVSYAS